MSQPRTSIPQTFTKGKRVEHYKSITRGRGKGIRYQDVCQYCNETRKLVTVRRAGGDLHLCRKHAGALGVI